VDDPAGLLADLLEAAGVRRIDGRLVLDDGLLDRQWLNPDWKGSDIGSDYAAPIGAPSRSRQLPAAAGAGRAPARDAGDAGAGLRVLDELTAASSARTYDVGALRPDATGRGAVKGSIGAAITPQIVRVPVVDPAAFFGQCLLAQLPAARHRGARRLRR
jgi:D-alanyl-D-alanine carboxypeptidase